MSFGSDMSGLPFGDKYLWAQMTSDASITGTLETTLLSLDLPAGIWAVFATGSASQSVVQSPTISITDLTTNYATTQWTYISGGYITNFNLFALVRLSGPKKISLTYTNQISSGTATIYANTVVTVRPTDTQLLAIRIG